MDDLDGDLSRFEDGIDGARTVLAAFDAEMRGMQRTTAETGRDVATMSRAISGELKSSFEGLLFEGSKLSDALRGLGQMMLKAAYGSAVKPVTKQAGSALASGLENLLGGLLPFADGGSFSQGRVTPFATGGVVTGPTAFPMRGGTGLMGEAGPEAIMPLARGADGKLGVRTQGAGGPVQVVMNIQTPDVAGFQRSQSQIAAQMSRALSRANRNR